MHDTATFAIINQASERLDAWIEKQAFKGWDPYDAMNSPLLKRLTFGNRRVGQVWVQLLKRSPVNLRPLLGVAKGYNPKGLGLFLATYWRKYLLTGDLKQLEQARFFADWLSSNSSHGYSGACWGYNFDWPNRGFFAPAGVPTIVNTSYIALSFVDLCRLRANGVPAADNLETSFTDALEIARSACDFLLKDLNQIRPEHDELCFSYTPQDRRYVHNANVLGAWLLAEVYRLTGEAHLKEQALASARYTARRQREDGSWLYGEGPIDGWVDNFHTGFVLTALNRIGACLEHDEFDSSVRRGFHFWKEAMFEGRSVPKYYPEKTYPIDIHSVAQAILTFLELEKYDSEAKLRAVQIAKWGIRNMQSPKGYFHYQIHRSYRIPIPYMRWSQAWMQRSLTELQWIHGQRSKDEAPAFAQSESMTPGGPIA